jgi:hypothetical protein
MGFGTVDRFAPEDGLKEPASDETNYNEVQDDLFALARHDGLNAIRLSFKACESLLQTFERRCQVVGKDSDLALDAKRRAQYSL